MQFHLTTLPNRARCLIYAGLRSSLHGGHDSIAVCNAALHGFRHGTATALLWSHCCAEPSTMHVMQTQAQHSDRNESFLTAGTNSITCDQACSLGHYVAPVQLLKSTRCAQSRALSVSAVCSAGHDADRLPAWANGCDAGQSRAAANSSVVRLSAPQAVPRGCS